LPQTFFSHLRILPDIYRPGFYPCQLRITAIGLLVSEIQITSICTVTSSLVSFRMVGRRSAVFVLM